ncbi:MAG: 3-coathanger stack domain-containing protein, partial [Bacteroidota bacterium]
MLISGAHSQGLPYVSVQDVSTINFRTPDGDILDPFDGNKYDPFKKFEAPPWILSGCYRGYLGIDGIDSYLIPNRVNLIDGTEAGSCGNTNPIGDGTNDFKVTIDGAYYEIVSASGSDTWNYDYIAPFSGHVIDLPQDYLNVLYTHGEYKQHCEDNRIVSVNFPCSQGTANYWESYYAFLNLAWLESNASNNWGQTAYHDEGPIVWPKDGFRNGSRVGGTKISNGIRHPTSIIVGDYIYIYFKEENTTSASGIKLARVSVDNATSVESYQVYSNGAWISSLPAGFVKENIDQFYETPGPNSSVVVGGWTTFRFSVARLNGSSHFIGLEEYEKDGSQYMALRLSQDLINWGERIKIVRYVGIWDDSKMHYPIFLDKTGWHNTAIDADEFYILGSWGRSGDWGNVNRFKLSLTCPATSFLSTEANRPVGALEFFNSSDQLETSDVISNDSEIGYTAANQIKLKPGFHAISGSSVKAQIVNCSVVISDSGGSSSGRVRSDVSPIT